MFILHITGCSDFALPNDKNRITGCSDYVLGNGNYSSLRFILARDWAVIPR